MEQIKENNNRFFALLGVLLVSIASFLIINTYVLADEGDSNVMVILKNIKKKIVIAKTKEASI